MSGPDRSRPVKAVISRYGDKQNWGPRGLRGFLEYRDIGLGEATGGKVGGNTARVIRRFEPGGGSPPHFHKTGFHLIFVLSGWLRSEFEGLGEVTLHKGDCIAYSGELPQQHIEYSEDFEVLQIFSPDDYETENVEKV